MQGYPVIKGSSLEVTIVSAIQCVIEGERWKGEAVMAKTKGVSSKTHTAAQCNDYANQHNPNSKAYRARIANERSMKKKSNRRFCVGDYAPTDWFCYSNPYDFD